MGTSWIRKPVRWDCSATVWEQAECPVFVSSSRSCQRCAGQSWCAPTARLMLRPSVLLANLQVRKACWLNLRLQALFYRPRIGHQATSIDVDHISDPYLRQVVVEQVSCQPQARVFPASLRHGSREGCLLRTLDCKSRCCSWSVVLDPDRKGGPAFTSQPASVIPCQPHARPGGRCCGKSDAAGACLSPMRRMPYRWLSCSSSTISCSRKPSRPTWSSNCCQYALLYLATELF